MPGKVREKSHKVARQHIEDRQLRRLGGSFLPAESLARSAGLHLFRGMEKRWWTLKFKKPLSNQADPACFLPATLSVCRAALGQGPSPEAISMVCLVQVDHQLLSWSCTLLFLSMKFPPTRHCWFCKRHMGLGSCMSTMLSQDRHLGTLTKQSKCP